jgi:hypothetical protein
MGSDVGSFQGRLAISELVHFPNLFAILLLRLAEVGVGKERLYRPHHLMSQQFKLPG